MTDAARLYHLLFAGHAVARQRRIRVWKQTGEAFQVPGCMLMPMAGPRSAPCFEVLDLTGVRVGTRPLHPMTFEPQSPYRLVPRAAALDPARGYVTAVLIEGQYTGDGDAIWLRYMEGHHAQPNDQATGF